MTALWMASQCLWSLGFGLCLMEMIGARRMMCDCRAGWMPYRHMKSLWLFITGTAYVASGVLALLDGIRAVLAPLVPAVGAYYLWRWWKHNKNKRKKLKDRALGVIRETAAGLKVVPVPTQAGVS